MTCFKCEKEITGEAALAYNLPGVTPGPIYFCYDCCPPVSADEALETIMRFIDPRKEKP